MVKGMGKIKSKIEDKIPGRRIENGMGKWIKCQSPKSKVQINVKCLKPKLKKIDKQNWTFEIYPLHLAFEL